MTNTPSSPTHEVEQIVAWLREEAAMRFRLADEHPDKSGQLYNHTRGIAVEMAADAIQSGEWRTLHLGGENEG